MTNNITPTDELRRLLDIIAPHTATLSVRSLYHFEDMAERLNAEGADFLIGAKQLAWIRNIAESIERCQDEEAKK